MERSWNYRDRVISCLSLHCDRTSNRSNPRKVAFILTSQIICESRNLEFLPHILIDLEADLSEIHILQLVSTFQWFHILPHTALLTEEYMFKHMNLWGTFYIQTKHVGYPMLLKIQENEARSTQILEDTWYLNDSGEKMMDWAWHVWEKIPVSFFIIFLSQEKEIVMLGERKL